MSRDSAGVAERWWQSFVGKDPHLACSYYAEDVRYADYGVDQILHGRQAVEDFWQGFFAVIDVDRFEVETHAFTTTDTTYAVEWTMHFKLVQPWKGFPPNPNDIALRGISVGDIADGKLVDHRDYYNAASILQQLGLLNAGADEAPLAGAVGR
jgi:steroid delta-isomerase-like uncharacterized protein